MRIAIWVLSGFAALWGLAGILSLQWSPALVAIPFALSALFVIAARRLPATAGGGPSSSRLWRLILTWDLVELAAIILVVHLLVRFGVGWATTPAIAIIVGLHFIPLARAIPFSGYYWTAAGVTAAGVIALFLPPPLHIAVATFGSAVALWLTTAVLLVRASRG
ncbi:hypothetical protein [Sphingopyxis panaciterrae]